MRTALAICLLTGLAFSQDDLQEAIKLTRAGKPAEAAVLLQPLADKGNPEAQALLGYLKRDGIGVEKDIPAALDLFRQAAARDNGNAQFRLAEMYMAGIGVPADTDAAVHWLKKAAAAGDPLGMHWLGTLHLQGKNGVEQDMKAAAELIRRAAGSGLLTSKITMINLCVSNVLGPPNLAEAAMWAASAAMQGHAPAVQLLKNLSDRGLPAAKFELGRLHIVGVGVEIDLPKGVALVGDAAAAGFADAHWFLGELHVVGRGGFDKDLAQARRCFTEAAHLGSPAGLFRLGVMRWIAAGGPDGEKPGVEGMDDVVSAAKTGHKPAEAWLIAESNRGNQTAAEALADVYLQTDPDKARSLLERLANAGSAHAQFRLGELLIGTERDAATAWLVKAARAGHAGALIRLGSLIAEEGVAVQDEAVAFRSLLAVADRGGVKACALVATRYGQGLGTARSPDRALHYLRIAAAGGHPDALRDLHAGAKAGDARYQRAYGLILVDRGSPEQAKPWLELAARAGDAAAQVGLGRMLRNRDWLQKAADQGSPEGMFALGWDYFRAGEVAEALQWVQRAADLEWPEAKARLFEVRVQADPGGTIADLEKRTREGDRGAMFELARIYTYGWGVKSDLVAGFKWLLLCGGRSEQDASFAEYRKLAEFLLDEADAEARARAKELADEFRADKKEPAPKDAGPLRAKVIELSPQIGMTTLILDVGADHGIAVGRKGRLDGLDATFVVVDVYKERCKAEIGADLVAIGSKRAATFLDADKK